jgi:hypothetical protein
MRIRAAVAALLSIAISGPVVADDGGAPPSDLGAKAPDSARDGVRLWWSLPRNDQVAIEIDDANLGVSRFETRKAFVAVAGTCDVKGAAKYVKQKSADAKLAVREVRVEHLDAALKTVRETRCVLPLAAWRKKLGERMVERLEDELDAHMSFLVPRKYPKSP